MRRRETYWRVSPGGGTDKGLALAVAALVWEDAKAYKATAANLAPVHTVEPPYA